MVIIRTIGLGGYIGQSESQLSTCAGVPHTSPAHARTRNWKQRVRFINVDWKLQLFYTLLAF